MDVGGRRHNYSSSVVVAPEQPTFPAFFTKSAKNQQKKATQKEKLVQNIHESSFDAKDSLPTNKHMATST